MTNLTFSSLTQADQVFLRTQLGLQLARADDQWYRERRLSDFIIYPSTAVAGRLDSRSGSQNFTVAYDAARRIAVIRFHLTAKTGVSIRIYNSCGQRIAAVFDGRLAAGSHRVRWHGLNAYGHRVRPGVYLFEIRSECGVFAKELGLVR